MPMNLTDVKVESYAKTFKYDLYHYSKGPGSTCLSFPLEMKVDSGGPEQKRVSVSIKVDECSGPSPDEALDQLAIWLRRLAECIEERKSSVKIPI